MTQAMSKRLEPLRVSTLRRRFRPNLARTNNCSLPLMSETNGPRIAPTGADVHQSPRQQAPGVVQRPRGRSANCPCLPRRLAPFAVPHLMDLNDRCPDGSARPQKFLGR